jgi:hypothetical protein
MMAGILIDTEIKSIHLLILHVEVYMHKGYICWASAAGLFVICFANLLAAAIKP